MVRMLLSGVAVGLVAIAIPVPKVGALDISGYRSWTKLNKEPVFMEPMVASLCVNPPPKWLQPSPHVPRYFNVFVNTIGKKAMQKGGRFPVGSIIVKEKFAPAMAYRGAAEYDAKKTVPTSFKHPELLTIMIKREKGYNPKCGDWEFRTARTARKLDPSGDITHCISCHQSVPKSDFVYRDYTEK